MRDLGAPAVAILSYGFWERRYAKDPGVVGRTVRLNGAPTTFVGVMPEGFSFPQKQDLWVPLVKTPRCSTGRITTPGWRWPIEARRQDRERSRGNRDDRQGGWPLPIRRPIKIRVTVAKFPRSS